MIGRAAAVALLAAGCALGGCRAGETRTFRDESLYRGEGIYIIPTGFSATRRLETPVPRGAKRVSIEYIIFNGTGRPLMFNDDREGSPDSIGWRVRSDIPAALQAQARPELPHPVVAVAARPGAYRLLFPTDDVRVGEPVPMWWGQCISFDVPLPNSDIATHADIEFARDIRYYAPGDLTPRRLGLRRTIRVVFTDEGDTAAAHTAKAP